MGTDYTVRACTSRNEWLEAEVVRRVFENLLVQDLSLGLMAEQESVEGILSALFDPDAPGQAPA